MIALLQRCDEANVTVRGEVIGNIQRGLLALIGIEHNDTDAKAKRLAKRLIDYRIFADNNGKMNLSVRDIGGGILLVPQFTLTAKTDKGTRPGFTNTAVPKEGQRLFNVVVDETRDLHPDVHVGRFGAEMKVTLVNDGPVTFWLQV